MSQGAPDGVFGGSYSQTAPYFIFRSIITIIASFISVSVLVIHYTEHQQNRFTEEESLSRSRSASRPRSLSSSPDDSNNPRAPLSPRRPLQPPSTLSKLSTTLEWTTMIIFSGVCIVYALLTIIEQVGRPGGIDRILCNPWTARVLPSAIAVGTGTMHLLYITHLHSLYHLSELFTYSSTKLLVFAIVVMCAGIGVSVLVFVFLRLEDFDIELLGQHHQSCNFEAPWWLEWVIGGIEVLVVICTIYLFLNPMLRIMTSYRANPTGMDMDAYFVERMYRISILASLSSTAVVVSNVFVGTSNAIWPKFVEMPFNCICIMFMTDYYPTGYARLCCLFARCKNRLFRKVTKRKLKSDKLFRIGEDSPMQAAVDSNDVDGAAVPVGHEKETQEFLSKHDLQVSHTYNESLAPAASSKAYQTVADASNSGLVPEAQRNELRNRKGSKHQPANTMDRMIMNVDGLIGAKQTMRGSAAQSEDYGNTLGVEMTKHQTYHTETKEVQGDPNGINQNPKFKRAEHDAP